MPPGYQEKFAELIKLCKQTKPSEAILIAIPEALGDTYEELIESLNQIADSEGYLVIVPRSRRNLPPEPFRSN